MTQQESRSGLKPRGGARPNSGPPRRHIALSKEAAARLSQLVPYYPELSRDELVSSLVLAKWQVVEEAKQRAIAETL